MNQSTHAQNIHALNSPKTIRRDERNALLINRVSQTKRVQYLKECSC